MQNKWKLLLSIAAGCLFVGLSLLAVGTISGGIKDVTRISSPKKTSQSFSDITTISLDTSSGPVIIKSGKTDKITVNYYTGSKFLPKVNLTTSDKTLTVYNRYPGSIISGPMEAFGFGFSQSESDGDYTGITITVPEGMTLEKITTPERPWALTGIILEHLTVKEVDYQGWVNLSHSTIEKGQLTGVHLYKSTLKNATIDMDWTQQFTAKESTLENVTINNNISYNQITAKASTFKQVTINNQLPIDERLRQQTHVYNDNPYYGELLADNTIFEGLTVTNLGRLTLTSSTFIGDNSITSPYLEGNISLTEKHRNSTVLDIQAKKGNLSIDSHLPKADSFTPTEGPITFNNEMEAATGKLSIQTDLLEGFSLK